MSHSVMNPNFNSLEFKPQLVGISWREEEGEKKCCTWIMCKRNCTSISMCSLVTVEGPQEQTLPSGGCPAM